MKLYCRFIANSPDRRKQCVTVIHVKLSIKFCATLSTVNFPIIFPQVIFATCRPSTYRATRSLTLHEKKATCAGNE